MRSLHVWLLTGMLAAAACKPAVRSGSTLQSENEQHDDRLREILIGGGAAAGVIVTAIIGIKKWDKLKTFPEKSWGMIKRTSSKIGEFLPIYKSRLSTVFRKEFPRGEWMSKFSLPYDSDAQKSLLKHLEVDTKKAENAVEAGKSVDDVLKNDSFRSLSQANLKDELMKIYGEKSLKLEGASLDEVVTKMIDTVKGSDVSPHNLRKELEKVAKNGQKLAEETAEAAS